MKSKGFTLIELLAVIVILAIIALIATPIILGIIESTKESANKRSVELYLKAVGNVLVSSQLDSSFGTVENGTYSIMSGGNICIGTYSDNVCTGKELKVDVDNIDTISGTITIENGTIVSYDIIINGVNISSSSSNGYCTVVSGTGTSIGNQIECGGENFFVIESDLTTIQMLASKNITVTTNNPVQSDSAGTTYFSTKAYWANWIDGDYEWKDEYLEDSFVYDSNSNLYQYVEAYEDYLQNTVGISSASATLLSSNQALEILGLISSNECYIGEGDDDTGCGLYPWATTTRYWTGYITFGNAYLGGVEAYTEAYVDQIGTYHYNRDKLGIRPVVTISKSDLS